MRRPAKPLTGREVGLKLSRGETGLYAVGNRVYLAVTGKDRGNWVLRYNAGTRVSVSTGKAYPRTREMGLGAAAGPDALSLAEALDKAEPINRLIRDGVDPLEKRQADAKAEERQAERAQTFEQVAAAFFAAKASEFEGMSPVHRNQWHQTLKDYAHPIVGQTAINAIGLDDMDRVLRPIWDEKRETASRLRGRLQKILDFATAMGWRDGFNPARLDGPLAHRLPGGRQKRQNHPALGWREAPQFVVQLRGQSGVAARLLEFTMLTAARTSEALLARWSELDLADRVWTVPAPRTKTGKKTGFDHLVPLCPRAVELIEQAALGRKEGAGDGFVFSMTGGKTGLSEAAMAAVIKRMNKDGLRWKDPRDGRAVTTHGMRATFRTWADEHKDVRTRFSFNAKEIALGHAVGTKVVQAYGRGQVFDERRELMDVWAGFLTPSEPSNVVQFPPARAAG